MKEYEPHIEYYSNHWWSSFSQTIPKSEWGNKDVAKTYLEKYWLPTAEYEKYWKPLQNKIFINQEAGLPELVFAKDYELIAMRGGSLMEELDYKALQPCLLALHEEHFIVVENTYGGRLDEPSFRLKYPTNLSWKDLKSGNFISSIVFEMFHNEYFMFSESGVWGLYSANEYKNPLHIIGFKPEHGALFREQFFQPKEEWDEIRDWLPPKYKKIPSLIRNVVP